jgi:transcriptional regulator with XRE-family HTH domain
MLLPEDQRRQLGAFLRTHREALAPEAAGLKASPRARRRTPGLRREEVAQLCGLSTTWYSWVEQGRDISLSAEALSRLAGALRLTAAERGYLFELTRRRDPAPPAVRAPSSPAPPELVAALRATAAPAYLLDRLWHASAWNDAAGRLFASWFGSGETSLLRYVFLDATARDFISDWENRARRLLAEFRADTAHDPEDAGMQDLVRDLLSRSPPFARFWNDHAVLAREGGTRIFNHPKDGTLRYQQLTLVPAAHPDRKLVMLLPQLPDPASVCGPASPAARSSRSRGRA